jgi:hypothetical protein
MSQFKLLKEVITFLNQADTSYMLTGSIVSSFQGEPRSTHDIDMMIQLDKEKIDSLLLAFPSPTYYIDKDMVLDGIKSKKMFKLLNTETGDKIDFYPLPDNEYESVRFSRKIPEDINGLKVWITSVEDTIISKLRWCKLSNGSEKQFKDALNVFEVQYEILDFPYIDEWIRKLNLTDLYKRLQKEREEL